LLRVLGRIGSSKGLPVLQASLSSQEPQIRDAAIRALAGWPTPEAADDLLKIAQTADKPVHKILALRGFVRLLSQSSDLSAQESVALYRKAMDLAPNPVEKKRVLSGLSTEKSLAALEMAAGYLDNPTLHLEAESSVVRIVGNMGDNPPQTVLPLLKRVVENTANETLRGQATGLINDIKGVGSTEPAAAGSEAQ
jgi:HEAT repeat protein